MMTILFLAANPRGNDRLALDREHKAIEAELDRLARSAGLEFRSKWAVGVDELRRSLNELSPVVLHFSGHGSDGRSHDASTGHRNILAAGRVGIVLQDGDQPQHMSEHALAQMIRSASPSTRIVVLNACYGAGLADVLCEVVDCVVSFEGAIEDGAARSFSAAFYDALAADHSVHDAVEQASATLATKHPGAAQPSCKARSGVDAKQVFLRAPVPGTAEVETPSAGAGLGGAPEAWPFDLFIAHPAANRASAAALYDLLHSDVRVFLAERSLRPDDTRDRAVRVAQASSRATVLLITTQSDAHWYLGAEVMTSLALHRASPDAHRVILVALEPDATLPTCLRRFPVIDATAGLASVTAPLRDQVTELRHLAPHRRPTTDLAPARDVPFDGSEFRIFERLKQVNPSIFEQILTRAGVPSDRLAPRTAPLIRRALDVAQLAALEPELRRRISLEITRHAP